jgi:HK97 gp10 family phage protein
MITADTRQLTALAADLGRAAVTVQRPVNEELKEAAKAIRATGRELVRKRSGRTARSITYSSKTKGLHYEIGPKWFVGRFLEFGTVNMPAYPFMQPAAERHLGSVPDRIAKAAADNTLTGRSGFTPTSLI